MYFRNLYMINFIIFFFHVQNYILSVSKYKLQYDIILYFYPQQIIVEYVNYHFSSQLMRVIFLLTDSPLAAASMFQER